MSKSKKVNEALNMESAAKMLDSVKSAQAALMDMTSKAIAEDLAEAQTQGYKATELAKEYAEKVMSTKSLSDIFELNAEAMKNFGSILVDNVQKTQAKMTTRTEEVMSVIKQ